MAKTKISEFDIDPANNTDINSINIAEGCAPSGINNAIRQLMSDLKEFQTGAGGDPFNGAVNGTVGATTPNTGAFTTLSASGAFSANGGATLGDASGDSLTINSSAVSIPNGLNFDSNTLVIDATNNRVGVGVASPSGKLSIATTGNSAVEIDDGGTISRVMSYDRTAGLPTDLQLYGSTLRLFTSSVAGSGSERMRITSTGNVGIGTSSPRSGYKLTVSGLSIFGDSNSELRLGELSATETYIQSISPSGTARNLVFYGTSALATLDSSGNLGLGVTPSTPYTGTINFQIGGSTNLFYYGSGTYLGNNCYLKTGTGADTYIGSGYATRYDQTATGQHRWNIAASGTAGNAISFTQAMTLDASGNLILGTTTSAYKATAYISGLDGFCVQNSATGTGTGNGFIFGLDGNSDGLVWSFDQVNLRFGNGNTERMRIDSSGRLLVGVTSGSYTLVVADGMAASGASGAAFPTANSSCQYVGKQSNNRSISAAGTINASGADYAEYMTKAGDFVIAKGDVCGIDANGKLTNVFADSVSFVVKSTDPSYVGGDVWANGLGNRPSEDASQVEKDTYELALEAAKKTVDRIAFAGQVPVNVIGANAGQYIVPVNDNGAIKGEAVSNPTFEQYQIAVGKVIAIEDDGRAKIIVKVA